MREFIFQNGQTIVFAGDSITDCGRRGDSQPYGNGYVSQVIALIQARYPDHDLQFVNAGISGNTVQDLRDRWHDDVLSFKPDWVTIKIGINDLHRTLAGMPEATPPDIYEKAYRGILQRTREAGAKAVLIDPFYISSETHEDSFRRQILDLLPRYLQIVEILSGEFEARHVYTHQLFQEQLAHHPAEYFCPEPVHPYANGHIVIAHELLKVLRW